MNDNIATYEQWRADLAVAVAKTSVSSPEANNHREWFWVLDGCAYPGLPTVLWELDPEVKAWPLYMNTFMEEAQAAGPWFVACRSSSPLFLWVLDEMYHTPLGILFSANKGEQNCLFEHLQNMVECYLPTQKAEDSTNSFASGLFRYYDPRVFYGIMSHKERAIASLVAGPACSIFAWEPGRKFPIVQHYPAGKNPVCSEPPCIPQALIGHLWEENKIHTVIGTLGGRTGEMLRAKPLHEAYAYVDLLYRQLEGTPFTTQQDLGFLTSYALLSPENEWKILLNQIVACPVEAKALSEAFKVSAQQLGLC